MLGVSSHIRIRREEFLSSSRRGEEQVERRCFPPVRSTLPPCALSILSVLSFGSFFSVVIDRLLNHLKKCPGEILLGSTFLKPQSCITPLSLFTFSFQYALKMDLTQMNKKDKRNHSIHPRISDQEQSQKKSMKPDDKKSFKKTLPLGYRSGNMMR